MHDGPNVLVMVLRYGKDLGANALGRIAVRADLCVRRTRRRIVETTQGCPPRSKLRRRNVHAASAVNLLVLDEFRFHYSIGSVATNRRPP
jgi:hypothetical protein